MTGLWLIAAAVLVAVLAGCSAPDCSYYGRGDAGSACVVVGPAPTGGGH